MSYDPNFIKCPACGSQKFRVRREITVYQTLFIHAVESDGIFYENGDELGDTLHTNNFDAAACKDCGKDVPLAHLFPRLYQEERTDA